MRIRLTLGWILILSLMAAIGYAQETPRRLSLAQALDLARHNNPAYLQTSNDLWAAGRNVTTADLSLLTPTADISGSLYAAQGGEQILFGTPFKTAGARQMGYDLRLGYRLSGATFTNRGLARADLSAAEADVVGGLTLVETTVRQQYLEVLKTKAQEDLASQSLERARENLNLAQARNAVGQATLIDVRRAEVERGQAEVAVMRATQNVENETLRLFQAIGVPAPEPARVELTDSFPVVEPPWNLNDLLTMALEENPGLRAARARVTSAQWNARSARSQYLPSLNISATPFGATRSRGQDTSGALVWSSRRSPWSISAGVSLPLFDRFQRGVQTSQARAREEDARLTVRSRELGVRAEVTSAFSTLNLNYRTIAIQLANRSASDEALELATQRYRVGSGTYIELLDARIAAERAAADYITAVYDYHRAIAALENAVGRPLR